MAFSSMLRRASTSLLPAVRRAAGAPRTFRSGVSTVLSSQKRILGNQFLGRRPSAQSAYYSSLQKPSADKSLIQVLQSEIECAEEPAEVEYDPNEIPFEIEDNLGERTILLKRKYQDEIIEVEVEMPNFNEDEEDNDDDAADAKNDGSGPAPNIFLGVKISKGRGENLEFGVFISPDELVINNLSIKSHDAENLLAYEGPDFGDLDENLQKAFNRYLEVRGIKPSLASFLYEYMANKDNKEYLEWLQNLKNFVEK